MMNPILSILANRLSGMSFEAIAKRHDIPDALAVKTVHEAIRMVAVGTPNPRIVVADLCRIARIPTEHIVGNTTYTQRIREYVRIRDGQQCRACGKVWNGVTRKFDVHHLNGLCGKKRYDPVGTNLDGLITLCHGCHFVHPEHSQIVNGKHRMPGWDVAKNFV